MRISFLKDGGAYETNQLSGFYIYKDIFYVLIPLFLYGGFFAMPFLLKEVFATFFKWLGKTRSALVRKL